MRLALGILSASLLWCQSGEPEVFTSLGKAYFAQPDERRLIEAADLALAKGPASPELLLEAARARDAVLRFSESIPLYTRGMDDYPADVRFPRFRGHRFISTRRFDMAIVDLKKAAELAPSSFDVSYHLALAYYLRGDFNHAVREYQRCLGLGSQSSPASLRGIPDGWRTCQGMDDDTRIAITEWAWRALRRAGKHDDAARLLSAIEEKMAVKENHAYFRTLLLYKGLRSEAQTLAPPMEGATAATVGYGVGLWHWFEGRKDQACAAWQRVLNEKSWAAFGLIAAEAELARGVCRPVRKR